MTTKWTQEESIAFECACEFITGLMAICSAKLADPELTPELETYYEGHRSRLAQERQTLHVHDHERIALISSSVKENERKLRASTL